MFEKLLWECFMSNEIDTFAKDLYTKKFSSHFLFHMHASTRIRDSRVIEKKIKERGFIYIRGEKAL
jgi:hypothetical protein